MLKVTDNDTGKKWISEIHKSTKKEKNWLDQAKSAVESYAGETESITSGNIITDTKYEFNILFSNVETLVPTVINSSPIPDIRTRFGDDDEPARIVSDILNRAIKEQIGDDSLQIELESMAQDAILAGRGIIRVRFFTDIVGNGEPTGDEILGGAKENQDTPGDFNEHLENERIKFEAVPWADYRHGPAKRWENRNWEAFRFCISKNDAESKFNYSLIQSLIQSKSSNDQDNSTSKESDDDVSGWEIWDKKRRQVIFIDDNGSVLKEIDDPLGLSNFFCTATPVQPITINGRLMPVCPFSVYKGLADKLDNAVRRKDVLIKAMKVKGWYTAGQNDMQSIIDLDDNEFAPLGEMELFAQIGGIQNAIMFWPFERFIAAIQQLDSAVSVYKQLIYEVTGISDILRGVSVASETATAQNIKSQWGSLRINRLQKSVERCAREIFIMMSQIIATKFSLKTLQDITHIDLVANPNGDPQNEILKNNVRSLLLNRQLTVYRVDVETGSTIMADLTLKKQEVSAFLQSTASYFQTVAPLVQQGILRPDAAIEIFAANARLFNLGKTFEDIIDNMTKDAKETIEQQKAAAASPPPEKPDPEIIKINSMIQKNQDEIQQKDRAEALKSHTELAKSKMYTETDWKKSVLQAIVDLEKIKSSLNDDVLDKNIDDILEEISSSIDNIDNDDVSSYNGEETEPLHNSVGAITPVNDINAVDPDQQQGVVSDDPLGV